MALPLLEGEADVPVDYGRELASLRSENSRLKHELARTNINLEHAKSESAQAVSELRRILNPLHQSLRLLFGEISKISAVDEPETSTSVAPKHSAVWDEWKNRFGGTTAKFIDALLKHGELDGNQLAIITQCGRSNVKTYIHKLNKANLINKVGDKFSLKNL